MKKFEGYVIVSDMDRTFLGEKSALVSKNLQAIDYFSKNGGVFTLATGRCYRVLKYIFPTAANVVSGPAILCNGAYLYDFQKNTTGCACELEKSELIPFLQKVAEKFPDAGYRISCERGYVCPVRTPYLESQLSKFAPIVRFESLDEHMDIPWHKLVFQCDESKISELNTFVKTLSNGTFSFTTSSSTLLEVLPKKASKGQKLRELKEIYPDRKLICVGDYSNDLDMLQAADIAACPENALDEIKAISTIHLCHHRDGCIADLIYKLDSSIKE